MTLILLSLGLVGPHASLLVARTYENEHGEEAIRITPKRKTTRAERRRYDERA